jgi:KaiC/GvpD/RAD55 family RecA-like ATPase
MNICTISPELEYAVLHALAHGAVGPSVVKPEELSKNGRAVYTAVCQLAEISAPVKRQAVLSLVNDVLGHSERIEAYLSKVYAAEAGKEVHSLLAAVRGKQALVEAANEISTQISSGSFDVGAISKHLELSTSNQLTPAYALIGDRAPERPSGMPITFKSISHATGGLYGMWVIGGETGVGKSTFALQLAYMHSGKMPVLYYDAENGNEMLLANMYEGLDRNLTALKRATAQFYIRPTIRTLAADVQSIKAPALLVVDSVQKFGFDGSAKNRRDGIDHLLRRLEDLKKRGYYVLVLSEISRASYGQVSNGGYAESRELEFSADMACQLKQSESGNMEFYITKNRLRPQRGLVTVLERVNSGRFRELDTELEEWHE